MGCDVLELWDGIKLLEAGLNYGMGLNYWMRDWNYGMWDVIELCDWTSHLSYSAANWDRVTCIGFSVFSDRIVFYTWLRSTRPCHFCTQTFCEWHNTDFDRAWLHFRFFCWQALEPVAATWPGHAVQFAYGPTRYALLVQSSLPFSLPSLQKFAFAPVMPGVFLWILLSSRFSLTITMQHA